MGATYPPPTATPDSQQYHSGALYHRRMARTILVALTPLSLLPLVAVGGVVYWLYTRIIAAQPSRDLIAISLAALAGLAAFAVIAWLILYRHTTPLRELASSIELFIAGNWEQRYITDRRDEIGLLASHFNQLAQQLVEAAEVTPTDQPRPVATPASASSTAALQLMHQLARLAAGPAEVEDLIQRSVDIIHRTYSCEAVAFYRISSADIAQTLPSPLGRSPATPATAWLELTACVPNVTRADLTALVLSGSEGSALANQETLEAGAPTADVGRLTADAGTLTANAGALTAWQAAVVTRQPQTGPSAYRPHNKIASPKRPGFEAILPVCPADGVYGLLVLFSPGLGVESTLTPFSAALLNELFLATNIIALGLAQRSVTLPTKEDRRNTDDLPAETLKQPSTIKEGTPAANADALTGMQMPLLPNADALTANAGALTAVAFYRSSLGILQSSNLPDALYHARAALNNGYPYALLVHNIPGSPVPHDPGGLSFDEIRSEIHPQSETASVPHSPAGASADSPSSTASSTLLYTSQQPAALHTGINLVSLRPYFLSGEPILLTLPTAAHASRSSAGSGRDRPEDSIMFRASTHPGLPAALLDIIHDLDCNQAIIIPALTGLEPGAAPGAIGTPTNLRLLTLLIIGQPRTGSAPFPPSLLAYQSIIDSLATLITRIEENRRSRRQIAELRSITQVGQAISLETDPTALYRTIHEGVVSVIGEIDSFALALYDSPTQTISIPYMIEEGQHLHVDPFPLGEGLTSIVVRTAKPLMLVEDTINKTRALGAKIIGEPALSWIGIPMLVRLSIGETSSPGESALEVVGVIIAQDIHREGRFTAEDQRLLTTLASQMAVVVRNARLIENTRQRAEAERQINEITARIRRQVDIEAILKTTAQEIGHTLQARRLHIEIHSQALSAASTEAGTELPLESPAPVPRSSAGNSSTRQAAATKTTPDRSGNQP